MFVEGRCDKEGAFITYYSTNIFNAPALVRVPRTIPKRMFILVLTFLLNYGLFQATPKILHGDWRNLLFYCNNK